MVTGQDELSTRPFRTASAMAEAVREIRTKLLDIHTELNRSRLDSNWDRKDVGASVGEDIGNAHIESFQCLMSLDRLLNWFEHEATRPAPRP